MKLTLSLVATVLVLVTAVLGLLMVFEVIDSEVFKEGLGKALLAGVVVGAACLAVVAINSPTKPTKKQKS